MKMRVAISCGLLLIATTAADAFADCRTTTCWDYAPHNSLVSWIEVEWDNNDDYFGPPYCYPFVSGDVIWVAAQTHLVAYDGSDPRHLRFIHATPIPRLASYVTVEGNIAYVTGQYGLTIVDVADPQHPVIRATTAVINLYRTIYRDGYLYAVGYNRVIVFDVHDPAAPFVKATQPSRRSTIQYIALHGDEIVAHDENGWLFGLTMDSSDSLTLRWQVLTGGFEFASSGEFIYVADSRHLLTYRFAPAGPPALIASRDFELPGHVLVTVVGEKLFVQDRVGIRVFGLESAPDLQEIGVISGYTWRMSPMPLGELVVMATGYGILLVADPDIHTEQPEAALLHSDRAFQGLAVRDGIAFGSYANAYADPRGIVAFDVSGPRAPQVVGELRNLPRSPRDMQFRDNYLFTNSLYCVDISDPANMRLVNSTEIGSHFAINDSVAFVCGDPGGWNYSYSITAVDISDPSRPRPLSTLPMGLRTDLIAEMEPAGDYLVVGAEKSLALVDVTDPSAMQLKWSMEMRNGYCRDLALKGDLVFYVGDGSVLAIVDISDKLHPRLRSLFNPPVNSGYQSIVVGNGVAYLSIPRCGTLTIDINDPDHPRLVGCISPQFHNEYSSYDGMKLAVSDDHVVMLTSNGDLQLSPRQCGDINAVRAVVIDVKPGDDCNRVPCGSRARGRISVALLTSKDFDATSIDPTTLRFGPGGAMEVHFSGVDKGGNDHARGRGGRNRDGHGERGGDERQPHRHLRDVDCDGDIDFVAHFDAEDAGFACGDTLAELTGMSIDGVLICGSSDIATNRHCRRSDADDGIAVADTKSLADDDGCGGEGDDADKAAEVVAIFSQLPVMAPNPFNPETEIVFALGVDARVSVAVYDLAGRRMAQLADGVFAIGAHTIRWRGCDNNGRQLPSGIYFVRIAGADEEVILRAALVR